MDDKGTSINTSRVFISGILFAVIGQIVHTLGAFAGMKYYLIPDYFPVWSKVMMPAAGPPPASFYAYSILFGLIVGMLFALVYSVIRNSVPGLTTAKKGIVYGLLVFLIAGFPTSLSLYLLINLPTALIVMWAAEGLIVNLLGGIVIAWLNK